MEKNNLKTIPTLALGITTAVIFLIALEYVLLEPLNNAALIGDWIGGFASALAFLWLIAGFFLQSKELKLQREELTMQREALSLQVEEFKSLNNFQCLEHVRKIIVDAELPINGNPSELITKLMISPAGTDNIFKSSDPKKVFDAYNNLLKHETPIYKFMADYSAALQMYLDAQKIPYIKNENEKPSTFIMLYIEQVKNAPYLSRHYPVVKQLSELLFKLGRVQDAGIIAGMIASSKVIGKDMWKDGAIEQLYNALLKELDGDTSIMPEIIKEYFNSK